MMTDPLGDMIARIKNAAMRKRSKVLTPASKLRAHVLDVRELHERCTHQAVPAVVARADRCS